MKKGTIEYTVKTERQVEKLQGQVVGEEIITEYWEKVRGYNNEDTFDPENHNSELVNKLRQEQTKFLYSNPNIQKYETRVVERLPFPDLDLEEDESGESG